jgi:hypothetical protein
MYAIRRQIKRHSPFSKVETDFQNLFLLTLFFIVLTYNNTGATC